MNNSEHEREQIMTEHVPGKNESKASETENAAKGQMVKKSIRMIRKKVKAPAVEALQDKDSGKQLKEKVEAVMVKVLDRIRKCVQCMFSVEKREALKNKTAEKVSNARNKVGEAVQNIKEKETEQGLRTYKLFYISDYEKEAEYLRSMSLRGYHFVKNDGFSFDFVKGEPRNYFYLLDFYPSEPDEVQKARWEAAGWEDIFHTEVNARGSWHFFRYELKEGDMLEYEENVESRLALFEHLTRNWQGILSIAALCTVFSVIAICMQIAVHGFPWMIGICIVLATVCLLVFAVYLNIYWRTRLRIIDIRNAQKEPQPDEGNDTEL